MYAVIQTGGKQYKVTPGQELDIELLSVDDGAEVSFDKVMLVGKDDNVQVGTPFVKGAMVKASVLSHGRAKKIKILKFKRRKHHMKRMGHRQNFIRVKINDITV